jgi:hypothetical protein
VRRLSWSLVPIAWAAVAAAQEPPPESFRSCFDASPMADAAPGRPPNRSLVEAARDAFASAASYRACLSFISLAGGENWGTYEYLKPDRRRWRIRHREGRADAPVTSLEVVQVGADRWIAGEGGWSKVAAGRTLQDAVPPGAWIPDPSEIVSPLLDGRSGLRMGAPLTVRGGPCEVWSVAPRPPGPSISQALCVGTRDQRPYRVASGGPAVEAYLQIEIYDYDAPLEIGAPP